MIKKTFGEVRTISSAACAVVLALVMTACGAPPAVGPEINEADTQAWTVPDSWTCETKVYETGGARSLGNDFYQVDVGAQAQGALRQYHPVDVAFDSIATVKSTSKSYAWTSSMPVRAIITSAGPGATTIFDYRPGRTSGVGVVANDNVNSLEPVYMLFCFDSPPPVCGDPN